MIDSLSSEKREAILNAIYSRQKIAAIKLVREAADCGLAEAKEFVEKYTADLEKLHPEKFTAAQGKGCSAVFAAGLAVVLALITAKVIGRFS